MQIAQVASRAHTQCYRPGPERLDPDFLTLSDYQRADAIKRANPASWKHVNLYGAYSFLDIGDGWSTSRNWSISWRRSAVGTPRHRTEIAIF